MKKAFIGQFRQLLYILIILMFAQFVQVHALSVRRSGDSESKIQDSGLIFNTLLEPNSLSTPNYLKVLLLLPYLAIINLILLLDTYLDSSNLSADDTFNHGYNAISFRPSIKNKEVVFVSISNTIFLQSLWTFGSCKNELTTIKIADKT